MDGAGGVDGRPATAERDRDCAALPDLGLRFLLIDPESGGSGKEATQVALAHSIGCKKCPRQLVAVW